MFAKLPHEGGHPEVVVVPGLECESVEFSLVHVGPTQKSDPNDRTGTLPHSFSVARTNRVNTGLLLGSANERVSVAIAIAYPEHGGASY